MIGIIIFVLIVIVLLSIKRKKNNKNISKPEIQKNVKFTIDNESDNYSIPIRQTTNGWCLNPDTPFELTVLQTSKEIAQTIRDLCDEGLDYENKRKLLSIFVSNNIVIKEIEEYKEKYSKIYNDRLNQMISECDEYDQLGLKDKESLVKSFRTKALESIYELSDIDIENIFLDYDLTIDDNLIQKYGFECINVYMEYYNKVGTVVSVGLEEYYHNIFDQMTNVGLSIKGRNIPIKDILLSQTLKTLNQIANNPEKIYKRKEQAIEYILSDQDKVQSIDNYVAFNELFKLVPIEELSTSDIGRIKDLWDYYKTEINLLMRTFNHSIYTWKKINIDSDVRKGIYSSCSLSSTNSRCRCAKDRMQTDYPITDIPKTPCHLGCSCWIEYK